MWKGIVERMDDLLNWRRKIGCFRASGPKVRWQWDPYGGKKVLTWGETLFGGLCFLASVLCAYSFVEETYHTELHAMTRCLSVWENPGWRRKRGWRCDEDLVDGGLTVGSVWVVSAFSAWGVHELYRRLRLLWGRDIELNPGPLGKQMPDDVQDARRTLSQATEPTTTTPVSSTAPVGLLLVGGQAGTQTRSKKDDEGAGNGRPVSKKSDSSSNNTSARADSQETVPQEIDTGTGVAGSGTAAKTKAWVTGTGDQHSDNMKNSQKVLNTRSGSEKVSAENDCADNSKSRYADKTATISVLQSATEKLESVSSVCQNDSLGLYEGERGERGSGVRESMLVKEKGGEGAGRGGGGVSCVSGESVLVKPVLSNLSEDEDTCDEVENNVVNESMRTILSVSCEVDEFTNGQADDGEEEVRKDESGEEEISEEVSVKVDASAKNDMTGRESDKDRSKRVRQTKTKSDKGVMDFMKEQMKSMVGAIANLTTELKAGQEEVKKRQEDFTKGQEDMRKGQDDMRRGQEDLKREMREEIRGVQKKQEEQGKIIQEGKVQIEQVLEKVEETQGKIEGLRGDIQKTQEEVKKNREDIQELKQKQEEARAESEQYHTSLEQEFDKLDSHSRRNNLKFFGTPEEGRGQREDSEGVILRLLNQHIPEGRWKRGNCEKAQRLGKRRDGEENSKPRPLLVMLTRPGDARKILAHKKARSELRERGIQVSSDLTQRQQKQLRDLKSSGQRGYFFRGNLVIQGENDRGGRGGRGWGGRGGVRGGTRGARGGINQSLGQSSGQAGFTGQGRGGRGRGNGAGARGAQSGNNNWIQGGNQGQSGVSDNGRSGNQAGTVTGKENDSQQKAKTGTGQGELSEQQYEHMMKEKEREKEKENGQEMSHMITSEGRKEGEKDGNESGLKKNNWSDRRRTSGMIESLSGNESEQIQSEKTIATNSPDNINSMSENAHTADVVCSENVQNTEKDNVQGNNVPNTWTETGYANGANMWHEDDLGAGSENWNYGGGTSGWEGGAGWGEGWEGGGGGEGGVYDEWDQSGNYENWGGAGGWDQGGGWQAQMEEQYDSGFASGTNQQYSQGYGGFWQYGMDQQGRSGYPYRPYGTYGYANRPNPTWPPRPGMPGAYPQPRQFGQQYGRGRGMRGMSGRGMDGWMNVRGGRMNNAGNFNAENMSGNMMSANGMGGGVGGMGAVTNQGKQASENVSLNGKKDEKNECNKTNVSDGVNQSADEREKVQVTEETGEDEENVIHVSDDAIEECSDVDQDEREVTVVEEESSEITVRIRVPQSTSSTGKGGQEERQSVSDDQSSDNQAADKQNLASHTTPHAHAKQLGEDESPTMAATTVTTTATVHATQDDLQARPELQAAVEEESRPIENTGPTKLPRPIRLHTEGPITTETDSASVKNLASISTDNSADNAAPIAPTASVSNIGAGVVEGKKVEEKKGQAASNQASQSTLDGGRMEGWQKARPKKADEKQGAGRLSLGGKGDMVAKKIGQLRASEVKKGGGEKGAKKKDGGSGNVVTRSQAGGRK